MSQTKLARQRPASAAPVGHLQAGPWRANSAAALAHIHDPLEGYDSRFSVDDDDNAPVVLNSSPMSAPRNGSSETKGSRPRSAVRPQSRSAAESAQQKASMSWRELMAEMLGDVTQEIIENVGQEFTTVIRIMRRDFDRAVSRISEEVKGAQKPTTRCVAQAVGQCTSTVVQELERVHSELRDAVQSNRVDMDFSEIADAMRDHRSDLERIMFAVQDSKMVSAAEVDLEPIMQAIRKSKADLAPILNAIQEIDLSPLIATIDEKRLDVDLTPLVAAIQEVASGVRSMRESKQEVELKEALRDKATTDTLQSIQEACKHLHGEFQDSTNRVLSAVSGSNEHAQRQT